MDENVPKIDLGVMDADGKPLSTGDRVKVTGSDRFGEDEGTVIGYRRIQNVRLRDGELFDYAEAEDGKPIRIYVRLDNGTDGDEYTASQGRVTKLEGDGEAQDAPAEHASL